MDQSTSENQREVPLLTDHHHREDDNQTRECAEVTCGVISVAAFILLSIFLNLTRSKLPQCYIQYFYVPGLNMTSSSSNSPQNQNSSIYLDLKLKRDFFEEDTDICYDDINLTLSYVPDSSQYIANTTIPSFCQGFRDTVKRTTFNAQGLNWTMAHQAISKYNKTAIFQVNLTTSVRTMILFWKSKDMYSLKVGANVEVNHLGVKVNKKAIQLSGTAAKGTNGHLGSSFLLVNLLLVFFFVLA